MKVRKNSTVWWGLLTFVSVLPLITNSITLSSTILIYALAAMACNLLVGYAGLLSFCQGVFFGVGGYIAGLILLKSPLGLVPSLAIAVIGSGLIAGVIGMISIRRTGIYFVMLTLAFAQLFYYLAYSQSGITGGDNGLNGVPRSVLDFAGIFNINLNDDRQFYVFVALSFLGIYALLRRVIDSPLGSTLEAIRENEHRVWSLGYDPRHYKILAFVISGAITGYAGALDGMMLGIVSLSNIDANMSQNILIAAILGGSGSLFGSVIGAMVLAIAGDFLSEWWPRWQLILGAVLVLLVIFAPNGFSGLWRGAVARWTRKQREQLEG